MSASANNKFLLPIKQYKYLGELTDGWENFTARTATMNDPRLFPF